MLDLKNAGLTELLNDFYTLTGLKLCIFDTDYEECASTPTKWVPLCARMRQDPEFDRRCRNCDAAHMQICRRTRKPLQYQCHAGLTEYLAPLYYEGVIVAFLRIRADVIEKIVRSGAKEETVDVAIEIDAQKNILRAIATGATELRQKSLGATELTREQLTQIAADSLGIAAKDVSYCAGTGRWNLFEGQTQKKLLGFIKLKSTAVAVLDREGVVRLRKEKGSFVTFTRAEQDSRFRRFLDENTTYSDANATIPKVFVFYKEKMLDLTGMQTAEQLYSILNVETEMLMPEEQLLAVAYK